MADRRRGKQRKRDGESEKPSKQEYSVAKHLKFNLPSREGKLVGMAVQYFIASRAVDMLLDSKWGVKATGCSLFTTRGACVDYCNTLLTKGIFHRAARVGKRKERDVVKKKKKVKEAEDDPRELTKEEEKKSKAIERKQKKREKKKEREEEDEADKEKESEGEKEEKKEKKEEEKKVPDEERRKKKKIKLEMHDQQVFKDGDEVYVWIYDPVPLKTFVIGLLLVLGSVAVCMFPLWPPEVRLGIYYLSLACAGFVGIILALCVIRLVLFCLVWGLTFGRHHFWLLPNLTEDVGFFDSFKPLYKHDSFDQSKVAPPKVAPSSDQKDAKPEVKDAKEAKDEKGSDKESVEGSEDNGYEIVDRDEFLQKDEDERKEGSDQEDGDEEVESKKEK